MDSEKVQAESFSYFVFFEQRLPDDGVFEIMESKQSMIYRNAVFDIFNKFDFSVDPHKFVPTKSFNMAKLWQGSARFAVKVVCRNEYTGPMTIQGLEFKFFIKSCKDAQGLEKLVPLASVFGSKNDESQKTDVSVQVPLPPEAPSKDSRRLKAFYGVKKVKIIDSFSSNYKVAVILRSPSGLHPAFTKLAKFVHENAFLGLDVEDYAIATDAMSTTKFYILFLANSPRVPIMDGKIFRFEDYEFTLEELDYMLGFKSFSVREKLITDIYTFGFGKKSARGEIISVPDNPEPVVESMKIFKMYPDVRTPKYQTSGAAGFDIHAYLPDGIVQLAPGETKVIKTGLKVAVPLEYELHVRTRSGLSVNGIVVANSPGTVDSDYRGEVGVILKNGSNTTFVVNNGDRVAQGVVCPVRQVMMDVVQNEEQLGSTERGAGGFGSTGTK